MLRLPRAEGWMGDSFQIEDEAPQSLQQLRAANTFDSGAAVLTGVGV